MDRSTLIDFVSQQWRESSHEYKYKSLPNARNHIRLIELLPAFPIPTLVHFMLRTYSIHDAPAYHALSYTWGDETEPEPFVTCDNGARLGVRRNLHLALMQLRDMGITRLWVDAVCINQDNVEEKDTQISIMKSIYATAQIVTVWLGPEDESSALAFKMAKELAQNPALDHGSTALSIQLRGGLLALSKLSQRPWFSRVWVVQEVASRSGSQVQVICGSQTMNFSDLVKAYNHVVKFRLSYPYLPAMSYHASYMFHTYNAVQNDYSEDLLSLLLRHRISLASEPNDKIFALVGLACDAILTKDPQKAPATPSGRLEVQAESKTEFSIVFRKVTADMLQRVNGLDLFGTPHVTDPTTKPDWPSWVPHWEDRSYFRSFTCRDQLGNYIYSFKASYGLGLGSPRGVNGSEIWLRGAKVDEIVAIGDVCEQNFEVDIPSSKWGLLTASLQALDDGYLYNGWERVAEARSGKRYPNGEHILDAYRRTLIAAHYDPAHNGAVDFQEWDRHIRWSWCLNYMQLHRVKWLYKFASGSYLIFISYFPLVFWLWLARNRRWVQILIIVIYWLSRSKSGSPNSSGEQRFRHAIAMVTHGRRMVRTEEGYIGLAPKFAKEGDFIVIISGARVPFVLRRGNKSWRLIGDAYIHGIMKGEGIDRHSLRSEIMDFCVT